MAERPFQRLRRTFIRHRDTKSYDFENRVGRLDHHPVQEQKEEWSDDSRLPKHPDAKKAFDRLHYLRGELKKLYSLHRNLVSREEELLNRLAWSDLCQQEHQEDENTMNLNGHSSDSEPTTLTESLDSANKSDSSDFDRRQTIRRRRETLAMVMPTRTVRLVRTQPGMPLGVEFESIYIPVRNTSGCITKPARKQLATFVSYVQDGSLSDKEGLRIGDEVLEVDGVSCLECAASQVSNCVSCNEGSITLVVRFSSDYKRVILHRKKVSVQGFLRHYRCSLEQLQRQEVALVEALQQKQKDQAVLNVVSSWQQAPSVSSSDDDEETFTENDPKLWISQVIPDNYHLSEADILRFCTTEQQLRQAILDLQEAWRAERRMFQGTRLILERRLQRSINGTQTWETSSSNQHPEPIKHVGGDHIPNVKMTITNEDLKPHNISQHFEDAFIFEPAPLPPDEASDCEEGSITIMSDVHHSEV
eukprot:gene11210-3265_t